MTYEQITAEQHDAVLVLTLNRPERLNAWTPHMSAELGHAIEAANDDPSIGAIVVTGAGRGFCAGADIEANFKQNLGDGEGADGAAAAPQPPTVRQRDWVALCRESKPLIAAINGPAVGVGLTMVLPFDVLLAADTAKLSARFVKMGLVPELASSHFLVARCGWGAASWLALSGTTVLGTEAAQMRLVDRALPADELLPTAMAMATELAGNPPPQVRWIKELLSQNAMESDLREVQRREISALHQAYASPEHHEAVRAFMEKRPPHFR
ncbi:MAG TPA: enoyl-CoA hydratase [Acidimicrobiaceae bacterium]|nr:enoyl-CoA hydratase [Acidimicrobiaceae bacterium]